MKIQFLGHACFLLEGSPGKVLVDPFLSGNPLAAKTADEVEADYILVSHGHHDHVGDAVSIAKRTGAVICSTVEVAGELFEPEGLEVVAGNIGGRLPTSFGSVKLVPAQHGSGVSGGLACGFVVEMDGKKIYHAGDTGLFADLQLLQDEELDAALLPIGDYYTMGPADAVKAVEMIRPGLVIPMHYNTFPAIKQDPQEFKKSVDELDLCQVAVLAPGQSLEL
ncbi:MAG: metal-dependent hydrolase [Limnochordia bacterium]|nr:metal-dependent hydrolase [Bacillota bacterium]HAN95715.1 metal-dependent hydrolase [Bacillota bacterium]